MTLGSLVVDKRYVDRFHMTAAASTIGLADAMTQNVS
jgi:hypothetical protein